MELPACTCFCFCSLSIHCESTFVLDVFSELAWLKFFFVSCLFSRTYYLSTYEAFCLMSSKLHAWQVNSCGISSNCFDVCLKACGSMTAWGKKTHIWGSKCQWAVAGGKLYELHKLFDHGEVDVQLGCSPTWYLVWETSDIVVDWGCCLVNYPIGTLMYSQCPRPSN